MLRWSALVAAFTFAAAALAQAPSGEPPSRQLRILFIGNDLIESTDVPARVAKLAQSLGRTATVETVAGPGYTLQDHWREARTAAAVRKGWDVVVLQQGPSGHGPERAQLKEYGRRLASLAREAGAKPAFLMTWPRSDRPEEFQEVIPAYREVAEASGAMLIPVGEAWLRAIRADRRMRLYSDLARPGSLGSDLAVLTIYLFLFPAGPQEFDEAFVAKAARALDIPADRRDALFDAATRAIDEPMALK